MAKAQLMWICIMTFISESVTNILILYLNRISRADWLLAACHELIFLLGEAKKSHIPSRATMCISYPLLGDDVYLISLLGQSSVSHIPVKIFISKVQDKYVTELRLHEYENTWLEIFIPHLAWRPHVVWNSLIRYLSYSFSLRPITYNIISFYVRHLTKRHAVFSTDSVWIWLVQLKITL